MMAVLFSLVSLMLQGCVVSVENPVINVKKKDLEWIKDHKNPNQVDLKITLYNTKTL